MRWRGLGESNNVEDRRGSRPVSRGGGLPIRGKAGFLVLLIVIVAGAYGIDLTPLLSDGGTPPGTQQQQYSASPQEEEMARFTSAILRTTEETWSELFREMGRPYPAPKLVLYSGATDTACGYGQAAMGPFYCPGDRSVFIDLSFYNDMKQRLGGGGDFAQGYVIAHEIGHHVQHLLGIDEKVRQLQNSLSQKEANRLSVRMELQADCFAGVWGHFMNQQGLLESGDLDEALRTATAIGDDRLQQQSSGTVVPDSFTHGTSKQRYDWFIHGYEAGNPRVCDTFSGSL